MAEHKRQIHPVGSGIYVYVSDECTSEEDWKLIQEFNNREENRKDKKSIFVITSQNAQHFYGDVLATRKLVAAGTPAPMEFQNLDNSEAKSVRSNSNVNKKNKTEDNDHDQQQEINQKQESDI